MVYKYLNTYHIMKKLLVLLSVLVILLSSVFMVSSITSNKVACTMEAKICPDGSAVGRTGPKCEFEKCPNESNENNSYVAPPKEATSCEQDSDCKIVDKDISCCSKCDKADYSTNQFMAINASWYGNQLNCAAVSCMACNSENNPDNDKWEAKCLMNECKKVKTVQDDCTKDSDCKLVYGGCGCEAVSILDQRDSLDEGSMQCIWNSCFGMNVTAVCKENKCARSNDDRIRTLKLSNGRNANIKVLPETASEHAKERLGELGFNITLKEVGKGNETKAVYSLKTSKEGRIFGFIKKNVTVEIEIDAESDGKVLSVRKPWWAFAASGI